MDLLAELASGAPDAARKPPTKLASDEAERPQRNTNARMFEGTSAPVLKRARAPAAPLEPTHEDAFAPPTKPDTLGAGTMSERPSGVHLSRFITSEGAQLHAARTVARPMADSGGDELHPLILETTSGAAAAAVSV